MVLKTILLLYLIVAKFTEPTFFFRHASHTTKLYGSLLCSADFLRLLLWSPSSAGSTRRFRGYDKVSDPGRGVLTLWSCGEVHRRRGGAPKNFLLIFV